MTSPTTVNNEKIEALRSFVVSGVPGQRYTYHVGMLITEREKNGDLDMLADVAWAMSDEGLIRLHQNRLGDDRYEYFAIRTPKPVVPAAISKKIVPFKKVAA